MKTNSVNKVLVIIIFSLLAVLGILTFVLYMINPQIVKDYYGWFVDILNKPLPIIGITLGAVLLFVWRIIVSTNYGKAKLAAYDQKVAQIEKAKNDLETCANQKISELKSQNETLRKQLADVCYLSTNKKIKDYGKGLVNYGEETINSETETN